MAIKATKRTWCAGIGDYQMEYVCDTIEDVANLPKCATGSTAMVVGGGKLYIVNASGEWKPFGEEEGA